MAIGIEFAKYLLVAALPAILMHAVLMAIVWWATAPDTQLRKSV